MNPAPHNHTDTGFLPRFTAALLAGLLAANSAVAATQYFSDAGGPLTWTTSAPDWANASGGPYMGVWTANNDAVFEGAGGPVAVTTVAASSLTFNVAGYTLAGSTITLATAATITKAAAATISSVLAGAATSLNLYGPAALTLSGASTYPGVTTVNSGRLILTDPAVSVHSSPTNFINAGAVMEQNITAGTPSTPTDDGYAQVWTGAGVLQKTGAGVLRIGFKSGNTEHRICLSAGGVLDVQGGDLNIGWISDSLTANHGGLNLAAGATLHNSQPGGMAFDWLAGSGKINNAYNSTTPTLTLGTDGTVNNAAYGVSNNTATFSGTIGYAETYNTVSVGTLNVIKTGGGTQILTGTNGWTGPTTISGGALVINSPGSLAATAVTAQNGGTLGGNGTLAGTVTLQGGATLAPGTTAAIGALTLNNTLTLNAGSTISMRLAKTGGIITNDAVNGIAGTLNYAGALLVTNVTSDTNLLANGDTFTLFSKGSGGYSGAFSVTNLPTLPNGLIWDTSFLASSGQIKVASGTLVAPPAFDPPAGGYVGAQSVAIATPTPGATIFYTTDGSTPTTNSPSGSSGLTVAVPANAATTIKAFGSVAGYTDSAVASATYVTASTAIWTNRAGGSWAVAGNWSNSIVANGSGASAVFNTLTLTSNAIVTLDSSPTVGSLTFGDTGNLYSWTVNAGSGGPLTLSATNTPLIQVDNQTATINAAVTGANGFTKLGAGTLTLGGANIITGTTTISQGKVSLNNASALSATANVVLGDANSGTINPTLNIGVGGDFTFGALTVGANVTNAAVAANPGGVTGFLIFSGITLDSPLTLSAGTSSGSGWEGFQTSGSNITGKGAGPGNDTLILTNAGGNQAYFQANNIANNFLGNVHIKSGVWRLQGSGGNNLAIPDSASLTVDSGASLGINTSDYSEAIDGLNGAGTVLQSYGTAGVFTIGANDGNGNFSGVISSGLSVTKTGAGTQIFSGVNTFTGATTVIGGTLLVNGSLASGSVITVQIGGTLGGTGTIYGTTTVQGGGVLSPGTNGIGTLSISNTLVFASGSGVTMNLNKSGAVLTNGRVKGMTGVNYGGTLLVTATGDALAVGDKFTLFSKASGAYSGTFASVILPPLAGGLDWSTAGLTNDGSIQVVSTNAVSTPSFNPPAGIYSSARSVTISSTLGSTIYYTTDGSTPTTNSPSGPSPITGINVGSPRTLKAYATLSGFTNSTVVTAAYTFLIAPNLNYYAASGGSLAINVPALLANCSGATTLQSIGTSANGATLTFDSSFIYYAAGSGTGNPDRFTYTVNDGQGHSTSGQIYVNFVTPTSTASCAGVSNGIAALSFAGIPNGSYYIQTTTNLASTNWWNIGMATANASGLINFPAAGTNALQFYRAVSAGNTSVGTWVAPATPQPPAPLASVLQPLAGGFRALTCAYTNNLLVANRAFDWSVSSNGLQGALQNGGADWSYSTTISNLSSSIGTAVAMQWTATLVSGRATSAGVAAAFDFANWSTNNYVMIPAAVYNGNRNPCEFNGYDAAFQSADFYNTNFPQTQSDVPRLSLNVGDQSKIEILTGNAATPAMCFFSPSQQRGFILLTDQQTRFGMSGLMIQESPDRSSASFVVSAPGVRALRPLFVGFTTSADAGATWSPGDTVTLNFQIYSFPCTNIPALLDMFHTVRKNETGPNQPRCITPASQLQTMYANLIDGMFTGNGGSRYYPDENASWISFGWVGGLMNTFPMLALGDATHLARVTNTFNYAIPAAQTACGYTHYRINSDGSFGDCETTSTGAGTELARCQGDLLFWMCKQLMLLKAQGKTNAINPAWELFAHNMAVAMTNTWNLRHEFGMYLDLNTGDVAIYNSTSGAMIPGGLALAAQYFNEPGFMTVAQQAATMYYNRDFVGHGQTDGACGDILENADSETSYGFMTALMALYETTGDTNWLNKSRALGDLCATWTISYDYVFPAGSPCYNVGAHVAGAVWASTQNKHAVAASCTSSADPLFKLYRAGRGRRYAELVRDIAACANDLTARSDRATYGSTPGNLMERVQTGDAEGAGAIGELPSGFNGWVVLGAMLQTLELPGIYVRVDTGDYFVFDHITATEVSSNSSGVTLSITNPTTLSASVMIFGENATQAAMPLGYTAFINWPRITVNAGATVNVLVKPDGSLQVL